MLNRYPLWKYLLILFIVGIGFIYALPNLYPADPAVQITGASSSRVMDEQVAEQVEQVLAAADVDVKSVELDDNALLVRLSRADQQQLSKSLINEALGDDYIVAINLAQTTPSWLASIGAHPMKLGLDLSGGWTSPCTVLPLWSYQ